MSEFDDLMEAGLAEAESQFGDTIKIGAKTYPGVFSDLTIEQSAAFGGPESEATGVFILRKSECPIAPADKSTVTVNGKRRRIDGITDDAASWNLGISE